MSARLSHALTEPPITVEHQRKLDLRRQRLCWRVVEHELEDALMLADDLEDGYTGYLIERAIDEARSRQFTPGNR